MSLLGVPQASALDCVGDGTDPTATFTQPTEGAVLDVGPGEVGFSGTAQGSACIAFVYLTIQDVTSGKWFDREGELGDTPVLVPATLGSNTPSRTVDWELRLPNGTDGNETQDPTTNLGAMRLYAFVVDTDGEASTVRGPSFTVGDTSGPTAPLARAVAVSPTAIDVSWSTARDPSGIAAYEVARDGTVLSTEFALAYSDTGLEPGTTYTYVVTAIDSQGNRAPSEPVQATTQDEGTEPPPSVEEWKFAPSGLDGAGMQNVIAVNPSATNEILIGGDVAGIHRSEDRGAHLRPSTEGWWQGPQLHIATVVFHPTVDDKVYVGAGIQGKNGGFSVSTDGGRTWELRSAVPKFAGDNGGVSSLPAPHPRSTGRLIEIAPDGTLYAGTFKDGLMRSDDDGRTWRTIAFGGGSKYIRGILLDPANPNILYVASYNQGLFALTNLGANSATTKKLGGSPATPEEIAIVDGVLYLAAGPAGVFKSAGTGTGRTLAKINSIPTNGSVEYMSVAGVKPSGSPARVYAGCWQCTKTGSSGNNIYRSTDDGRTFSSITADPSKISYKPRGSDRNWWLADANSSMMIGKGGYIAAQIEIDPDDPDKIYVAGRSGAWASDNGGTNWVPIVRGLGATIPRAAAASPDGRNVYVALADWVMVASTDGGANFVQSKPPEGNVGYSVAADPRTGSVYVGVGERDANRDGELFRNDGGNWVSEGLGAKTGHKRVLAVGVGYNKNDVRIVLAAVEGAGIWRKEGNGSWAKSGGDIFSTSSGSRKPPRGRAVPTTDLDLMFLYDPAKGVYRSTDTGKTWQKIWNHPASGEFGGFLSADPASGTRVYVNDGAKLWRLDGAGNGTVGTGITTVDLGIPDPGPVAVGPTREVLAVRQVKQNKPAALLLSRDFGETFQDLEDPIISGLVAQITGMGAYTDPDDINNSRIYMTLDGMGMVVGSDDGSGGVPSSD